MNEGLARSQDCPDSGCLIALGRPNYYDSTDCISRGGKKGRQPHDQQPSTLESLVNGAHVSIRDKSSQTGTKGGSESKILQDGQMNDNYS